MKETSSGSLDDFVACKSFFPEVYEGYLFPSVHYALLHRYDQLRARNYDYTLAVVIFLIKRIIG